MSEKIKMDEYLTDENLEITIGVLTALRDGFETYEPYAINSINLINEVLYTIPDSVAQLKEIWEDILEEKFNK
jgi:hypothetical protein